MTQPRILPAALAVLLLLPLSGTAQEDSSQDNQDPGFLERMIQNALGGDGRDVRISGLEGALSSTVRIAAIDVADKDGTWLSIRDVTMNWSRLALLRRRVDIESLTISSVEIERAPIAPPAAPPSLEAAQEPAQPFALPELPVSIDVGKLALDRLALGQALTGQAAEMKIDGAAHLAGGEGTAKLDLTRTDAIRGLIALDAGFDNQSRQLKIALDVEEEAGGLIATVAKFPGAPSVDLSVKGDAPLSDFEAVIALATDGAPRLQGTVDVAQPGAAADGAPVITTITADLGGDITPLFAPQYQEFFGTEVALTARVLLDPVAGTDVERFDLNSHALALGGRVRLAADGLPQIVDVRGRVGTLDGLPVALPLPGPVTQINSAVLRMDYDAARGEAFLGRMGVLGLRKDTLSVDAANLAFDGTLERGAEGKGLARVATDLKATLAGLSVEDAAIDQALAAPVVFDANVTYLADPGSVAIRGLSLTSDDLAMKGSADIAGFDSGIEGSADLDMTTGELARFAPIVGMPLRGSFDGAVKAGFQALTGAFDLDAVGKGQDLAIGQPQVDPLIGGASDLNIKVHRGTDGIRIDRLDVTTPQLTLTGGGVMSTAEVDMKIDGALAEANLLAPQLKGPLTVGFVASGAAPNYQLALNAGGEAVTAVLGAPAQLTSTLAYFAKEGTVDVSQFALNAGEFTARGSADIAGLNEALSARADMDLTTGDLARLAPLAGLPLAGRLDAHLAGGYATATGDFDAIVKGAAETLAIGNPKVDPLLAGRTQIDINAKGEDGVVTLTTLDIANPQLAVTGGGTLSADGGDLGLRAAFPEAKLLAPQLEGPLTLDAHVAGTAPDFDMTVDAGGQSITRVLGDPIALTAKVNYPKDAGSFAVSPLRLTAGDLNADGELNAHDLATAPAFWGNLRLVTGNLARLAPLAGMPLKGSLDGRAEGAYDTADRDFGFGIVATGQDIAIGTPQVDQLLRGTTRIDAAGRGEGQTVIVERLTVQNPALDVAGNGTISPDEGSGTLKARLANLGLFVPQLQGPLTVEADGTGSGGVWKIDSKAQGPAGLRAAVGGSLGKTDTRLQINAGLGNLGVFVPQIPGPVNVTGAVTGNGTDYFVDLNTTAPAGMTAALDGRAWGPDGTSDMKIDATLPLQIANAFMAPRSLSGTARADLTLRGKPEIGSLSGRIAFSGARFTDPGTRLVLENMALNLGLAQSRADVDFSARVPSGGRITLTGPVQLAAPYDGDLLLRLASVVVNDPQLYRVEADGSITLKGPLAGGARIAGRIELPRTEITIPSTLGGGGPIPEMRHKGDTAKVRVTRERAGLNPAPSRGDGGTGAPVAYPLDVTISAPRRIFIRGRGLDAELGGELQIGGDTAHPIPSGRFELVRGRMDILSQVLNFSEANIYIAGDLTPELYMVATSDNASIDAKIEIAGPVSDPEISFSSTPELPQDEVLAQLFFGKPVRELSPLEVAQLVSAISTLTGGGGGLFGKLRDGIGVDQLNVGSDSEGNTEVTAGKYISEDVYTDVTVNSTGTSRIELNYDLNKSVTVKGGFDSEGDTRFGITFERDY